MKWYGDLPLNGKVIKLKYIASNEVNSFVDGDWIESPYITDSGVRLLQTGNIGIGRYKEQGDRYISEETFNKLKCKEVKPNDILICRLAAPVARACLAPTLPEKMITSVDVCILKPNELFEKRYLIYLFSTDQYLAEADIIARGSTRQRISRTQLGNIKVLMPFKENQIIIANYLDKKVADINFLIEQKNLLINKLNQQRQSLITEAVTKGLNPNVKMKDSGVEWIGEIPEHWDSLTFRRVTNLQQGLQIAQEERFYEEGLNRYEYITVKSLNYRHHVKEYIENPSIRVICDENEVLLARTGATGLVITGVKGVFHNNFFKVNFDSQKVYKEYLVYYLKQVKIQEHFQLIAGTTTIPDLNHGSFYDTALVLPNLTEQKEIVEYLNAKLIDINNLKYKVVEQVRKLKEYRQSLIYEAVTGKVDVRGFEG